MDGEQLVRLLMRFLPDDWILWFNEYSLDELDKRNLIIWSDEKQ